MSPKYSSTTSSTAWPDRTPAGATNFDNRSFRLYDEANLNVYDADFARAQAEVFRQDLASSKRMTLMAWEQRPWKEKALEKAAGLLHLQL